MGDGPEELAGVADLDLTGTNVVVTGSTDGIGRAAARAFGRLGASVVVHGRDRGKGEAVVADVEAAGGEAHLHTADFASRSAVRGLADAVADTFDRVDVLVNNAGGLFSEGRRTDDGVEYTFAVNHLAPYLLTRRLLEDGAVAPGGRVVTVSSAAHRGGSMEFESLRSVGDYSAWDAYSRSKLANVLFTRELAARLDAAGSDVTATCLHPGAIPGSAFSRNMPVYMRAPTALADVVPDAVGRLFYDTVADGAANVLYAAVSPETAGDSGVYYDDLQVADPSPAARDDTTARRLWTVSAEMVGLDPELSVGDDGRDADAADADAGAEGGRDAGTAPGDAAGD